MSGGVGGVKGKNGRYPHAEGPSRAKKVSKSSKKTEAVAASKKRERSKETEPSQKSYQKLPSKKPGPIKRAALESEAQQIDRIAEPVLEHNPPPRPLLDRWVFSHIRMPTQPEAVTVCTEVAGVVYSFVLSKQLGFDPGVVFGINYYAKLITRIALDRIM